MSEAKREEPSKVNGETPGDTASTALPSSPFATPEQALADPEALLSLLFAWAERGWIRDLDAALPHRLARLAPDGDASCLLAAMLVSHQAGQGHLLLDLNQARRQPESLIAVARDEASDDTAPPPPEALLSQLGDDWANRLECWSAVAQGPGASPLVLEAGRLYLRRYWRNEQRVASAIAARLSTSDTPTEDTTTENHPTDNSDAARLRPVLDTLFPPSDPRADQAASQKLACALGARAPFAVITGGPGTGKTTTVIRLLALLQTQAIAERGAPLAIRLAAPTGKAAARLSESIRDQIAALDELPLPDAAQVRASIPHEVSTLHRLLGARPDTRHFHHHRLNPLPLDMVAVDEASMVDIDMMAALLDALPPHARLVLLGDKDQLASVEAGAVLGNLCARAEQGHYRNDVSDWLEAATGLSLPEALHDSDGRALDQSVAMLRHSFRFDDASGIGQLARAINAGDSRRALAVLDDTAFPQAQRQALPRANERRLMTLALDGRGQDAAWGYRFYLGAISPRPDTPEAGALEQSGLLRPRPSLSSERAEWDRWASAILEAHAQFQLLTPLRAGHYGVESLNQRIEQALARAGLIDKPDHSTHWYEGRPVLVTGNDYALKLMNGDIGIALKVPVDFANPEAGTTLRVAFPAGDGQGGIRWVLPSRLQRVETVFAMTVHKSQGSEFVHTALVMPDTLSPILTRELVYTAVTRAKKTFTLLSASDVVLAKAIERRIARQSRLFQSPGT
ncbi:exodeoxyribonuclease V subunit alpha [Halomonas sp. BN3-1]|uniref:exodeoxyribonuclease V subunit alpha n=1 Tax=Halomonas sp. BN3-1 TaxID=2082393 RepID=UPI000D35C8A2|nr:exodeoxyribonuclease V subunit alpha [Halomonas sp. BN3-1]